MALICKQYTFDAAHHLPGHKGKCARPHGHTYKVEIILVGDIKEFDRALPVAVDADNGDVQFGPVSDNGMVCDFDEIDAIMKPLLARYLDHRDLNELPDLPRSTAEAISCWIGNTIVMSATAEVSDMLEAVRVWETPNCYAETIPDDWQDYSFGINLNGEEVQA